MKSVAPTSYDDRIGIMKGAKEMEPDLPDLPIVSSTRLFIAHWLKLHQRKEIKIKMKPSHLNANHFSRPVELS